MDPNAFLNLADRLSKEKVEESLRTSVSRSYYGLFNSLAKFIQDNGYELPKAAEAHKITSRYLHNCGVSDMESIAGRLNDLRSERNHADYDMSHSGFESDQHAIFTFIKAKRAYNDFKQATSSGKKRNKISLGIAKYLEKIQA